ncbi:MAG TPA: AsmA family protein, partial [Hyphomicrobiaceae bacterium]|nr:AsmA family protein [Hyphomicrobiaceae bacterium]
MTGSPTSDRSAVWRQDRRTDAAAARWAGRGSGRGRGRGPVRWLAVTPYAGLALVCLALGAVAFVLVAPPLGVVRDRLVDEVRASTGRSLVVHGPISATLFPRVVVSMTDVAVLPPEGFADGSTVTVPSLEAELSLRSLLSRRPKIERVTLHRPTFELTIDAQGRRSWDIAASRPRSQRLPATDSAGGEGASPNLPERPHKIEGVASVRSGPPRPWAVRVEDGTVRYRDERSGTRHEIAALNLDLGAEGRGGPVAVSGSLAWQGEPWRFSGTAAHEILEGRQGPVTLKLAGAPVEAAYAGTVAVKGGFAAEGALSLGRFAYKGLKIGPSELAVSVDAGVANVKLQQIELYDGRGQGTLTLDATGETPALAASLKLADLSLLPLLGDAAGVGWIDGRGTVALDLAAQGRSAEQIVETMRGKAQLAVADGALTGIDIDR